jgi:ABC-type dipeptide/oligopeptide/nickel transport system ATPase component
MNYSLIVNKDNREELRKSLFENINNNNLSDFLVFLKENDYEELFQFFYKVKSNLIDIYINKSPIVFNISDDKYINITGESGSGKSTYVLNNLNTDDYQIVETDVLFDENRKEDEFINHLRKIIFDKYKTADYPGKNNLKINIDHFNEVLEIIMNESKNINKTVVIDSGQFRHLLRYDLLKGKMIIMRTSIKESLRRAFNRFMAKRPDATKEEIEAHHLKKSVAYESHKKLNNVIIKCFILYEF